MSAKVLIVDDEPDLERLVRQKLRRQVRAGQLELLSASNGVEALALLAGHRDVSVALCDINMPQMDGLTLLDRLQEFFPEVKAVMISAYCDLARRDSARARGAVDFLTKPIDLGCLETTLTRLLDEPALS